MKRRIGFVLGALLFATITAFSDRFVLSFRFLGAKGYESAVLEIFERYGVERFGLYPKGRENELCAELMKLPRVTFASVKKQGTIVKTELRISAFSSETLKKGPFVSLKEGKVLSLTVLRGTPRVKVGDAVKAGEILVEDCILTENGEKTSVCPIAKVTLLCLFEGTIVAENEEDALLKASLFAEGVKRESTAGKRENGFFVRIVYEYTASVNF